MNRLVLVTIGFFLAVVPICGAHAAARGMAYDLRGQWVGNAQGTIFGAEGSVTITQQDGEDIYGIVEGGNFLGRARFSINGKVRGNQIYGDKDGHTFQGFLYPDGTIRGVFRASDGDAYKVILRRPYSMWGAPYSGMW
jgi:hypothetical protein